MFNYPDTTDIEDPIIIFEPNGSLKYQSSSLVKVTISDDVGFNPSSLKYLWNNSIEELEESDFATANSFISGNNISTPFVNGTYYLWILVKDLEGNNIIEHSNPFRLDQEPPAIVFGTNGDPSYTQIGSSVVTVDDNLKVNENSLKYIWNTSTTKPYVQEFEASGTSFTNGSTVSSPSELNGIYYLWVYGEDETGNGTTEGSNAFHLDNLAPVITISGDETVTIKIGDTYNDAGATAIDNIDGSLSVTTTSTVNVNATGTYTVTYNAEDGAGNEATPVVRTVIVKEITVFGIIYKDTTYLYGYMYKMSYNGSVWTASQIGTYYQWIDISAADENNVYGIIYKDTTYKYGYLYKMSYNGTTWTGSQIGNYSNWMDISAADENNIYGIIPKDTTYKYGYLYKTSYNGTSWSTPAQIGNYSNWMVIVAADTNNIYGIIPKDTSYLYGYIYKISYNGASWLTPTQIGTYYSWLDVIKADTNNVYGIIYKDTNYKYGYMYKMSYNGSAWVASQIGTYYSWIKFNLARQ